MMQTRLPKTKRTPDAFANSKITDRSFAVIAVIARYRFILARDIVRVVGGNEDVTHRHLQLLFHRNLVGRFALPMGANRGEFVYFLENATELRKLRAASNLSESDFDWEEIGRNRQKYGATAAHSAGQFLFIEHELMISRFHADIETAVRYDGNVLLDRWRQGSTLWNTVQLDAKRTLPHRPDALFTLRFPNSPEGQQYANFLYEADRETSSLKRIREKLEAHVHFFIRGEHLQHYGFRKLRAVVIETISRERATHIREVIGALARELRLAGRMFWVACIGNEDGGTFLQARRWMNAEDDRLRSLVD